ncbi:MAG: hypothetical protein P1U56_23430 [Saprospiraceae bacterium]|nr:hypothetical protein [Saprospiraceae bacterium]
MRFVNTKFLIIFFVSILTFAADVNAQGNVGIGTETPDNSALLELDSNSKGILIPRLTATERMSIVSPANALMVYDTDSLCFYYYEQTNTTWINLCNAFSEVDPKVGSLSNDKVPNWNGTELEDGLISDDGNIVSTDSDILINELTFGRGGGNSSSNVASGKNALLNNTSGTANVGTGHTAMRANTTGKNNVAVGFSSMYNNSSGKDNVALGFQSLYNNTGGSHNTSIGLNAGFFNTTGIKNVFLGYNAGFNATGSNKLFIENSGSNSPLIYGDFATDELKVNGDLEVTGKLKVPDLALNTTTDSVLVVNGDGRIAYKGIDSVIEENDPKVGTLSNTKVPNWNGTELQDGLISDDGIAVTIDGLVQNNSTDSILVVNGEGSLGFQDASTLLDEIDPKVGTLSSNIVPNWNGTELQDGLISDDGNAITIEGLIQNNSTDSILVVNGEGSLAFQDASTLLNETDPKVGTLSDNKVPNWNGTELEDGLISDDGVMVTIGGSLHVPELIVDNTRDSVLVADGNGSLAYRNIDSLIIESDPKVGSLNGNVVPRWDGTTLSNGLISDNGNVVTVDSDMIVNGMTVGRGANPGIYPNSTVIGESALLQNTSGSNNSAIGQYALFYNSSGSNNTAIGGRTLLYNTSGSNNSAIGESALQFNTFGSNNTATGWYALSNNISGLNNTAIGNEALLWNQTGSYNTSVGNEALLFNQTGSYNTSVGKGAAKNNNTGNYNTSIGYEAGHNNESGDKNIYLGFHAGYYASGNNKLYIENSTNSTPLIYGDFGTRFVGINAKDYIGPANFVVGNSNLGYGGMYINSGIGVVSEECKPFYGYAVGGVGYASTEYYQGSKKWALASLGQNRITVDSLGNVGLGTYYPTQRLDVNGKARIQDIPTNNDLDEVLVTNSIGEISKRKISSLCGLAIGDIHEGGMIFYLDETGCHGLVCKTTDESESTQWSIESEANMWVGATYDGMKAGQSNTKKIVDDQTGTFAAQLCDDLIDYTNDGIYDDWYLPSKEELDLMYYNVGPNSGLPTNADFDNAYYWTSTEYSLTAVWVKIMHLEGQFTLPKYNGWSVRTRAIRAF